MQYIELKIDGLVVDLPPDGFSVELTYRASNGIRPAGSNSERSITLPASKTNKAKFYDWQIGTEFKPMYLSSDGVPVLIGKAQLKNKQLSADAYGVTETAYQVALYGNNADWIIDLGDKRLGELDWVSERHKFTVAVVGTKFNEAYPADTYGYHFWKQVDWTYADPPPFAVSGNFAAYTLQASPFIFIPALLTKIFNSIGYEVESEFFFNTDEGKGLILPVILPEKYPDEFNEAYLNGRFIRTNTRSYTITATGGEGIDFDTHEAPAIAPDPFADSVVNPVVLGDVTGRYTPKATGYYQVDYALTIDNIVTGGIGSIALILITAGGTILNSAYSVLSNLSNGDIVKDTFAVFLNEGVPVYTQIVYSLSNWSLGDTFDITAASVTIKGEAAFFSGTPIDFAYLLQDWKCTDLIKGLSECFNLQFETDNTNGKIRVEPKDAYLSMGTIYNGFLQSPAADFSTKWDVSKGATDTFDPIESVTIFRYNEDGDDKTAQGAQENSEYKLFEARYTRPTTRFKQGDMVMENSFFAPTMHILDSQIKADSSLKTPIFPLLWKEDYNYDPTQTEKQSTYKPRLLWFGGQRGTDGQIRIFNGVTISEIDLPVAFAVNYNDTTGNDPNLSYGNVAILGNEVQGLAQRFFLRDMARSRFSLSREASIYFNSIDILNLTFRDKIALDGQQWLLKEVTSYKPLSIESTSVQLEYDAPDDDSDLTNLTHSPVVGYVSNELPIQ